MSRFQVCQTKKRNCSDQFCFRPEKLLFVCSTILHIVDLFAWCLSFKAFKLKNGIVRTSFASDLKNNFCVIYYSTPNRPHCLIFKFQVIQSEKRNSSDQFCFRTEKLLFVCSTILHIVDLFAWCLSFKAFKLKNGIVQTSFVTDLNYNFLLVL